VHSVDGSFTREPKLFSWAKPAAFHIFSSNYTVQEHILRTAGDAVREHLYFTKDPITMINQSITINLFWLIFWNLHSPSTSLQKTHFHTTIILTSSKIWMEVLYLSPLSLKICMQPMRQLNMHSTGLVSFPWGSGMGWGGLDFWGFFLFPSSSQCVPKDVPNSTPHFCLISCAHSCPLFN
jgi:hypothetical protein